MELKKIKKKLKEKAIMITNFFHLDAPVEKQEYERSILNLKDFNMLQNI